GPVAWYEAHLVSEQGWNMYGGTFPGGPVIFHGFNPNLGWANTVNKPDLIDVYQLNINPFDEDEYLLDGHYRPFEQEVVTIDVKLWGPFAFPARQTIYRSAHGPVIRTEKGDYAVRWAGMDEYRQLQQYYALNKARNFAEWQAAMSLVALPSINYVYGDAEGNIAFLHNAKYPRRAPLWDWQKDLPGDRSELIWHDYYPLEAMPFLINPGAGIVFNANNTPFKATNGNDNLRPENYPPGFGLQTNDTNRALRLEELTRDLAPVGRQDLLRIKFDKQYSAQSKVAATVREIVAMDWHEVPELEAAAQRLAAWDLNTDRHNRAAALGVLTTRSRSDNQVRSGSAQAFRDAVAMLNRVYGRTDPEWGEVNRIIRGDVDLPVGGAPDVLRAIYPAGIRDDGKLHAAGGDTHIILAEWDSSGQVSASTIHQFGSATLDKTSPHYADQVPLFADEKFRPVWFNRADIEQHAERRYRPGR
ncbi:MAG: penicillin acylase family protein, partial [Pseudomonadales bacterium]|nr:penicillin acylase family protein [Pseudomonadales bacterium]